MAEDKPELGEGSSTSTERNQATVAIIGTGDFGRGLALRLTRCGYNVVIGSRRPNLRNLVDSYDELAEVQITTIKESIESADIIFLAIPASAHASITSYEASLVGKIVVDVTNADKPNKQWSMTEELANHLPKCKVVKGFNTIPAYALQSEMNTGNRDVYICSDHIAARAFVLKLARDMGFTAIDSGGLRSAREMESLPHQFFTGWWIPGLITLVFFFGWTIYTIWRYYYARSSPYTWSRFPVNVLNKIMAVTGITMQALCYLPGNIAAFVQLINGTKYKRFPFWLDRWMKMRKHLGVYSLILITLHSIMSIMILNPAYFSKFYEFNSVTIKANHTTDVKVNIASRLTLEGEIICLLGLVGWIFMILLGLSTIPAIGQLLNWKEWTFIQSYFGIFTLAVCLAHALMKGAPDWVGKEFSSFGVSMAFTSSMLPGFTLITRLLIWLPCIYIPVNRIRKGKERGVNNDDVEVENGNVQVHSISSQLKSSKVGVTDETKPTTETGHENPAYNNNTQF